MAIGDLIFSLMGQPNPRDELMKSIGQQANAAMAPAGQPGQQMQDPVPEAYKSPPDLMQLYSDLINRQERNAMIGTGLGLLASSLAHPQNRRAVMEAGTSLGGGGTSSGGQFDPITMMKGIQDLQKGRMDLDASRLKVEQEAAQRQREEELRGTIPDLAKQMGLPEQQVRLLFETGQLDEFIQESNKPHTANVTQGDGTIAVYDTKTGKVVNTFGTPKPPETITVVNPDGSQSLVNKATGAEIAKITEPGGQPTPDMIEHMRINKEREERGDDPIPLEEWLLQQKKAGAQQVNIGAGEKEAEKEAGKLEAKRAYDTIPMIESAAKTMYNVQTARSVINRPEGIVSGSIISPYEQMGRKIYADVFGIPDDASQNTDTFIATMKENVLSRVKELGTGNSISNADRDFINQAFGGDITMTAETLKRVMAILERGSYIQARKDIKKIESWNKRHPNSAIDIPEMPELSQDAIVAIGVKPEHLQGLRENPEDKEGRKMFERLYGPGTADIMLGSSL